MRDYVDVHLSLYEFASLSFRVFVADHEGLFGLVARVQRKRPDSFDDPYNRTADHEIPTRQAWSGAPSAADLGANAYVTESGVPKGMKLEPHMILLKN